MESIVVGALHGLGYALLAIGLMLVYKIARFINFSHGALGVVSALVLGKLVLDYDVPYWVAFVMALSTAAAVGLFVEVVIVKRLFREARVKLTVASIAVSQVLFPLVTLDSLRPNERALLTEGYPLPWDIHVELGSYTLTSSDVLTLLCVSVAGAALIAMFRYTKIGLQIRAVSANIEAAELAGMSTRRVSMVAWMLAAVLSGTTAILLASSTSNLEIEGLGAGLMTRALAAALVGQMVNLGHAVAGGVALGVFEQLVFDQTQRGGITELLVFCVMLGLLLWRATSLTRITRRSEEEFDLAPAIPPLPADLARASWLPVGRKLVVAVPLLVAVLLPFLPWAGTYSRTFLFTQILIYAIAGYAVFVLVGWSGQLSLGQWALVGVGAYTTARMANAGHSLVLVMLVAGLVAAAAAVVVALPALRVRGVFLAASTLSFAVVAPGFLFGQRWVSGGDSSFVSVPVARMPFFGELTDRVLYHLTLAIFLVLAFAVARLRRSGAGLRILAVRDNARKAAASGISPQAVNMGTFAFSGFVSGVAGALWAYSNRTFDARSFPTDTSLILLALVLIGGLGSPAGPLLATLLIVGVPLVFELGPVWMFISSGLVLLIVLIAVPGGLAMLLARVRDRLARAVDRSLTLAAPDAVADTDGAVVRLEGIVVRFGGLAAVDHVDLTVARGEALGVIGLNGAGKTTLMECISGNVRPSEGRVLIKGRDVTHLGPALRPYLGVGRTFQDGSVFKGLTVMESVLVALEADSYSDMLSPLVNAPWERWSRAQKTAKAEEVLAYLGLDAHRDHLVSELSTGQRKLCDLATVLVREPDIIVLDEPTAGLLDDEVTEVVGHLMRIREQLAPALVVVEHDMNVISELADRICVMEAGRIMTMGTTSEVFADERVRANYLGEHLVAAGAVAHNGAAPRTRRRSGSRA